MAASSFKYLAVEAALGSSPGAAGAAAVAGCLGMASPFLCSGAGS